MRLASRVTPNPSLERGPPPGWHLARVAVLSIIGHAGQAPSRFRPLSSNVRQHHGMLNVLATVAGAAVAAEYQMHLLAPLVQARQRRSGLAPAPWSAHLQSVLSRQRFAAKDLCLSMRCVQSVRGAAATRRGLPFFTAGGGGGLGGSCAISPRWRISGQ